MKNTAILKGYDKDKVVYEKTMSLDEYYDGEHPWDDKEGILKLKLSRLTGRLYDTEGILLQDFETAFSEETGEYIGSKVAFDDGTENKDGIYKNGSMPFYASKIT